jgi:hypothetical protein
MDYSNHVAGFTKLFSGLVHSTVWREEMHVKVVWITMLALADRNGRVLASMPGLADASRVSLEQCEEALKRLSAPDKHSRTKTNEGRRIREVDGGWELLNYVKYRNLRDDENRRQQVREAVGRYRQRHASVINVSRCKPGKAQAEAEAEAESRKEDPPSLPPADHAERAIKRTTDALRTRLYALVAEAEAVDPKHRDPTELMRLFTSYDKQDGRSVKGVVNAALLSHERLEKSIADAEIQIREWRNGTGSKP